MSMFTLNKWSKAKKVCADEWKVNLNFLHFYSLLNYHNVFEDLIKVNITKLTEHFNYSPSSLILTDFLFFFHLNTHPPAHIT